MAIIKDRRTTLQSRLQELEKEKSKLTQTDPMVSLLIKVPFNKKKSTFPSACLKILAMCIVNSSYYLWWSADIIVIFNTCWTEWNFKSNLCRRSKAFALAGNTFASPLLNNIFLLVILWYEYIIIF